MTTKELTLASLLDLDGGRISEAFMVELRRAVSDCDDRPVDGKARKVTLELELKPRVDVESGQLESVDGKFFVTSSVPKRRSKAYSFDFRKGGRLAFETDDEFEPMDQE